MAGLSEVGVHLTTANCIVQIADCQSLSMRAEDRTSRAADVRFTWMAIIALPTGGVETGDGAWFSLLGGESGQEWFAQVILGKRVAIFLASGLDSGKKECYSSDL
jgi:hypothetical protein